MINTILGKKLEMTSAFDAKGHRVPLTVIEAGPCSIIQVKTKDKDGYTSVQLGFGEKKKAKKPLRGIIQKVGIKTIPRYIKEARITNGKELPKAGEVIKVGDVFSTGDLVTVSGISKGKGFTGVVKRWGFAGGPKTHGQSDRQRAPGSIGQTTTPGRVFKGKKMAGRKGGGSVTIQNLEIIDVIVEKNLLKVKGAVPGARGSLIFIHLVKKAEKEESAPKQESIEEEEQRETPEVKEELKENAEESGEKES